MISTAFQCTQCKCMDLINEAYPDRDFQTEGPPSPWLCTLCQGRPWHGKIQRIVPPDMRGKLANVIPENTVCVNGEYIDKEKLPPLD
jgi:hypothetical protein